MGNSVVLFQCARGYTFEGVATATCQSNGEWSKLPKCKANEPGCPTRYRKTFYMEPENPQYHYNLEDRDQCAWLCRERKVCKFWVFEWGNDDSGTCITMSGYNRSEVPKFAWA